MSELPRPIDPDAAKGLCHGRARDRLRPRHYRYIRHSRYQAQRAFLACRAFVLHLAGLK